MGIFCVQFSSKTDDFISRFHLIILSQSLLYRGIDGVLKDYLLKFVPWICKLWYLIAIVGFAGLVNFNFNDVGVCKAIQMIWSL